VAIAAIGSGFEGSGESAIQSKRSEFGIDRLLAIHEALRVTSFALDHEGQTGYFVECVLGGVHGLGIADLIEGLHQADGLGQDLKRRATALLPLEQELFLRATSLDQARYQRAFPGPPVRAMQALFG
jgi:hypothetical protein